MFFSKTALHIAIEKRNVELVKNLLDCPAIDINIKMIFTLFFFYKIAFLNV